MLTVTKTRFEEMCNEFGWSWSREFSVSWNTGGNRCDCWGGNYTVSAEAPEELTSLDEFLMKFFPKISFMEGRMIFGAIETKETYDCDYYGGSVGGIKKYMSYDALRDALERLELLEIIEDANDDGGNE